MQTSGAPSTGPLSGVRVLELCQIAAGPFTGSLLADLGADVVKVENPVGGDGMRNWPPLSRGIDGRYFSENFASLNRNKRSIALDLKKASDVSKLKALTAVSDVFIENFRAGVAPRLGLGYNDLRNANPRLIYCSITGYGQAGPYAEKGAFDVTVQGMSGLMSVTGEEGRPPVKCGVPAGDFCAGLYAAFTIASMLRKARETGEGGYIDCSMLGALLGISALQTSEYFGTGKPGLKLGSAHPRNAPYQAFLASDKYFVLAAGNDSLWKQVAEAVGLPELVHDQRFLTQSGRAEFQNELASLLEPQFRLRAAREWLEEFDRRGVPCAPINDYPAVLSDPQVEAMGLVKPMNLPNGVATRTVAFPIALTGYEFEIYRDAPELGAHNEEVFAEWLKPPQPSLEDA